LQACVKSCDKPPPAIPITLRLNWTIYGDGGLKIVDGQLQIVDPLPPPDNHIWTRQTFSGDFALEFDFTTYLPFRGGQITSYCAMPRVPGASLAPSGIGWMENYYNNITCYHFSFARVRSQVCNMRKTGKGLWMCGNSFDPCQNREKTYRCAVYKIKNNHLFVVDGRLVQHYVDAGVYGDSIYSGGYIGFRNWSGLNCRYDNIVVTRLKSDTPESGAALNWQRVPEIKSDPLIQLPSGAADWAYEGISIRSKITRNGTILNTAKTAPFSETALKTGGDLRTSISNPFQQAAAFSIDWSGLSPDWTVTPGRLTVNLESGTDSLLTFRLHHATGERLDSPPVAFVSTGIGFHKITVKADGTGMTRAKRQNGKKLNRVQYAVSMTHNAWSAEIAVPLDEIANRKNLSEIWRFNFTRQRSTKDNKLEYGTWCGDFNAEWQFGFIKFN